MASLFGHAGFRYLDKSLHESETYMLKQNDVVGNMYQIMGEIGRGGVGTIYLAYHLHLQKYVVLKRIPLGPMNIDALRRESNILKNLHHEYLPQIYDFVIEQDQVFTVMDYIQGNDLGKFPAGTGYLTEAMLRRYLRQVAVVLRYLEKHNPPIVHSDIKPTNIILQPSTNNICVIDFNISFLQSANARLIGLSSYFASPEQVAMADMVARGLTPDYALDVRTDIYSTGATFYYLMTGIQPTGRAPVVPLAQMKNLKNYSGGFTAIIDKCMQWDRNNRYQDAQSLLRAVNNIKKQDARYKRYVVLQTASILVSAALIAGGTYGVIRGVNQRNTEMFRKEITHLETEGVSDTAERDALALLNDSKYKKILAGSPESEALINHILGDVYYTGGDYVSAVTSYKKALERAKAAKVNLTDYYRDLGLALSYADRLDEAKTVLYEAEANGAANASQQLIRAVICYKEQDYAGCIEIANALMSEPTGSEAKARAAIVAARAEEACANYEEEIGWLKTAGNYSSSSVILEEQGRAYMDLVRTAPEAAKRSYAELAADCYERLNANRYVSMENRLNLALVYRILEKYNDSIDVLEKCLEDDPENLVAHMYLAFDYDAIEMGSKARIHVQEAWRIYEKSAVSADNQSVDEGALEELKILLRKYTM